MARRQLQIAGTERPVHNDIEKAAEAYREVRDDRMEMTKREKQKQLELLAVMKAHKISRYKYDDQEGEELLVQVDEEPKVKVRKTGEAESEVGEGLDDGPVETAENVPRGLIAQAEKSMADANVEEDATGDVVVPEKAAAKSKRGKGRKAK